MSETDMTEYAELLHHLSLLARGKHDDVSIAADAAGAITALLAERDAMSELLAIAYQLAGAVDAPVRFLDAFSRHKGRIDDLLPVDATECGQVASVIAERDALQAEVLRLRVAMAKAAQRADDWPNSNDDPADVLSDCADTLYGALDAEQTDRGDP